VKLYDAMGISSEHPSGKCYRGLTQIKSVFHLDTEDLHECNGIHGIPDGRQSGKIAKGWNIFHNSFKYMLNVCLVSERYTLEALIHLAFILQYKKDQTKFGRYVYRWLLRPTPHIASILNFCLHFANDILWKYSDVYSPQMYTLHRCILSTDVYSPQTYTPHRCILSTDCCEGHGNTISSATFAVLSNRPLDQMYMYFLSHFLYYFHSTMLAVGCPIYWIFWG